MTAATAYFRTYDLPWTPGAESEERFRRILRNAFIGYAVFAVVLPFLPVPELPKAARPDIPERVVQLIVAAPKPPPPPPVVEPKPELPKPEPKVDRVEPKAVVPLPVRVEPRPEDRQVQARERAAKAGIVALADELADLRDQQLVADLAGARADTGSVGAATRVERSLVTAKVGQGSGGINTAALSRNTGGGTLRGRDTTKVASSVAAAAAGADEPVATSDGRASRSREEIEMVFDQNKGAIFALYNRALRTNPALQGKLVLRLTIEASGEVSACEVVSTDLNDAELERKLVARVKMFRFEARDVAAVTTTKPIDFFPA
jgi:outer membrane biosynthesis protein TonB